LLLALNAVAAFGSLPDDQKNAGEYADHTKFKADPTIITSNVTSTGTWVMYKQCDSKWANQELGMCSADTICSSGCAMSSVAMILKTKGCNYDPSSLDHWLTTNGGYANGCDIVWSSVSKICGVSYQGMEKASESDICNGLSQMHGIVANVHNGAHWVLLTGCLGNGVFSVNDPGYSTTSYTYSEILQEAVYH